MTVSVTPGSNTFILFLSDNLTLIYPVITFTLLYLLIHQNGRFLYDTCQWLTTNFEIYIPDNFIFRVCITHFAHSLPHLPFETKKKTPKKHSIRKMQIHYQLSILSEIILYGKSAYSDLSAEKFLQSSQNILKWILPFLK